MFRFLEIADPAIAEHAGVVHLQVFRVDARHSIQHFEGLRIIALQEENAGDLVEHHPVLGVLRLDGPQRCQRPIVITLGLLDQRVEEVDPSKARVDRERFLDIGPRGLGLPFLDEASRYVQPTIGIVGFSFGHAVEGVFGAFKIAL